MYFFVPRIRAAFVIKGGENDRHLGFAGGSLRVLADGWLSFCVFLLETCFVVTWHVSSYDIEKPTADLGFFCRHRMRPHVPFLYVSYYVQMTRGVRI